MAATMRNPRDMIWFDRLVMTPPQSMFFSSLATFDGERAASESGLVIAFVRESTWAFTGSVTALIFPAATVSVSKLAACRSSLLSIIS